MKDRHEFFDCDCVHPDHLMRVDIFQWSDQPVRKGDVELSFTLQLSHYLPFHKRVWAAIRYIFKVVHHDWYTSTIVKFEDIERLKNIIDDYEARTKDTKKETANV